MNSSHQIRETAVQLLYCLHLEGIPSLEESSFESFWSIFFDKDYLKLLGSRVKAIAHLTQDRDARLDAFETKAEEILGHPTVINDYTSLLPLVRNMKEKEATWTLKLLTLQSASRLDPENKKGDLQLALDDFFEFNGYTFSHRSMLLENEPVPGKLAPLFDSFFAAVRRLHRIGERLLAVEHPSQFPGNPDVIHLRSSEEMITTIKGGTNDLVLGILTHLSSIDEAIAGVVDNFRPERIDPVDRAILRLGAYELLYKPGVPLAAVISSSQDIARKFSNTESPKFVRGVLNAMGKKMNQPSTEEEQ